MTHRIDHESPAGPIAVFDSGVGGLTVLAALRKRLPAKSFVYLGDTARVPYGTKSARVVAQYALEAAWYLTQFRPAALVVACNSASAAAMDALRAAYPALPIFGVIEPGARAAVAATRSGRIAVLATEGTVASGAYPRALLRLDAAADVAAIACPLFVPLAEEGWVDGAVPRLVAEQYLRPVLARECDTIVLGCTHYPLLHDTIAAVAGPATAIVDSATPLADEVAAAIGEARDGRPGDLRLFTSDYPERFLRIGARFLGEPVAAAERVPLEEIYAEAMQAGLARQSG